MPWQQGEYDARAEIIRDGAVTAAAVSTYALKAANKVESSSGTASVQPTPTVTSTAK